MFNSELNSFLVKFLQLREAGKTAHLDLDTFAGKAWVGIRVMLDDVPVHHQQQQGRRRSPAYFRRQERRKAAARAAAEGESSDVIEEVKETEKSGDNDEDSAEQASDNIISETEKESEKVSSSKENSCDRSCEICDFKSRTRNGLEFHMKSKHARIEQLDGNTSYDDMDSDYMEFYLEVDNYINSTTTGQAVDDAYYAWDLIMSEIRKYKLDDEKESVIRCIFNGILAGIERKKNS